MKTHIVAAAMLLAACAAPRAERSESPPEEPPDEGGESHASATCTNDGSCALDVVALARRRTELEAETEARMSEANTNAQTKQVAERWMKGLAKSIADERDRFSQWCEVAQGWNAAKRKSGARGLTPDDLVKWTGQPTQEAKPESGDGSVEARAWMWEVSGALSKSVSFAILFMRPAGSDDPWVFAGCQWCAEGGPATSPGCVMLPAKKP